MRGLHLAKNEQCQRDCGPDQRRNYSKRSPAVVVAVNDPPHRQEHTESGECDTGKVERLCATGRFTQRIQRERNSDDRNRHVDPEDPLPREPVDYRSTDHGTHRDSQSGDATPDTDCHGALGFRYRCDEEGQRERHDRGCARALKCPGRNQQGGSCRQRRSDRCSREQPDSEHEHPAAPPPIAERRRRKHQRRKAERVRIHEPLKLPDGRIQLLLDHRQRARHHEVVEGGHEHGQRGSNHRYRDRNLTSSTAFRPGCGVRSGLRQNGHRDSSSEGALRHRMIT